MTTHNDDDVMMKRIFLGGTHNNKNKISVPDGTAYSPQSVDESTSSRLSLSSSSDEGVS